MEDLDLPQDVANQTNSVDESRRRFSKAGLVVSGVLLTLASRPSLGGINCKSPSGFLSGNISAGKTQYCSGLTPGYWGTHGDKPNKWPLPYYPGTCKTGTTCSHVSDWTLGTTKPATMFNDTTLGFNCSGNGKIYKTYSMMQVIWLLGSQDPNQLGSHCVAALLNARMGWTPVLTEAQVRNIFNEWNLKGYFEPTAGVKWYGADIVTYLKSTMT